MWVGLKVDGGLGKNILIGGPGQKGVDQVLREGGL